MKAGVDYVRQRGIIHWQYTLLQNQQFISKLTVPAPFRNEFLHIRPSYDGGSIIDVYAGAEWNGATLAPDFKNVIEGTLYHDLTCDYLRDIAKSFGWSRRKTRKWSDKLFNEINRKNGFVRPIKRLYYRAVRIFGGIFSRF